MPTILHDTLVDDDKEVLVELVVEITHTTTPTSSQEILPMISPTVLVEKVAQSTAEVVYHLLNPSSVSAPAGFLVNIRKKKSQI
jgi:hypothetical protein